MQAAQPVVEERLLARLERLDTTIARQAGAGREYDRPADILDAATESTERAVSFEMTCVLGHLRAHVNRARMRVKQGTYGLCDDCGRRIDQARLEAVPFAVLCVDCKRLREAEPAAWRRQ